MVVSPISITEHIRFVESIFGSGKLSRDSANFDVWCPICASTDKTKKKLSIHIADGRLHCWSCGYKAFTLAPLIKKYGSADKLNEYRNRYMPETERAKKQRDIDVDLAPKLVLPDDFRLIVTSSMRDPDALALRSELSRRKVSERDMWYFKLGYSDDPRWRRRVIVPSFDVDGELNYFTGRAVDKFRRPKYDSPNVDKYPIIFNELNVDWSRELVLCEGPFDLMKCPDNAVSMLGSDLNERSALFNAIVVNNTPIALAMDADMRTKKMPRVARKLAEYDVSVRIVHVPTDPGDMTKSEFLERLREAKQYCWDDTFNDRLEAL